MTVQARAARGAEYFDCVAPGWEKTVNVFALNVAYSDLCPLGQVSPKGQSFDEVTDRRFGKHWAARRGFLARKRVFKSRKRVFKYEYEVHREYAALTDAWRAEIAKRVVNTLVEEVHEQFRVKETVNG